MCDGPQHDEDKNAASQVDAEHQVGELGEGPDPEFTQGVRHRTRRGDRCEGRDQRDHSEKDPRDVIEQVADGPAVLTESIEREAEEQRDQQDLQDIAFDKRRDKGAGDEVQQGVDDPGGLRGGRVGGHGLGVKGSGRGVKPRARVEGIGHDEPDDQGQGGDDFEIDQGAQADLPSATEVAHTGEAHDHGGENDGSDEHLDESDEGVAEGLELGAERGLEIAEETAQHDAEEDLEIQGTKETHGGGRPS